ncbi:MAG: hypothetical protein AB1765_05855, partial [Candidatus Hydrogenedentota bacterium]
MKKFVICFISGLSLLLLVGRVYAHTPIMFIEDNGDGTIYVEGGFSDGSSGAGVKILLKEKATGKVLWQGKLNVSGCIEALKKPNVPYLVVFDAGPGHVVEKEGPPLSPAEAGVKEEKKSVEKP